MNAATPRRRREGWPWPASQEDADALQAAEALVNSAALSVAHLSAELRLAVQRLEEAQMEASLAGECVAAREAGRLIERAQRQD